MPRIKDRNGNDLFTPTAEELVTDLSAVTLRAIKLQRATLHQIQWKL
jgi:prolyl-tRNA synthetase